MGFGGRTDVDRPYGRSIIRAQFLNRITEAYADQPDLVALVTAPYFAEAVAGSDGASHWAPSE